MNERKCGTNTTLWGLLFIILLWHIIALCHTTGEHSVIQAHVTAEVAALKAQVTALTEALEKHDAKREWWQREEE